MALSKQEMKQLARGMVEAMPPQPVKIVGITGEMFTVEALDLAGAYDKATNGQRAALDQIAKAFKKCAP